jgi:hypothetical protein
MSAKTSARTSGGYRIHLHELRFRRRGLRHKFFRSAAALSLSNLRKIFHGVGRRAIERDGAVLAGRSARVSGLYNPKDR